MSVRINSQLVWLNECFDHTEMSDRHEHVGAYLLTGEERSVLIDSGSFYHRDSILGQLEDRTDAGPDAIVLSHSDYPHSANIEDIRSTWNDVTLVASSGAPSSQGLSDAIKCDIGGHMTVEGRTLDFIDPPLADRSHTTWIYDRDAQTLFTADGFGHYHRPGACDFLSTDFENGIDPKNIYEFHRDTLVWLRYVDPESLRRVLTDILGTYDIRWIAPIHGNPIAGDDLDRYLENLITAAARISDDYTIPTS